MNKNTKIGLAIAGGTIGFFTLIIVICFTAYISMSNRLNNASLACDQQWSQTENVMQRRADLIPNLASAVKGEIHNEQKVFGDLAKARQTFNSASTPKEKMKADTELNSKITAIVNAVHENYPKLESHGSVHALMEELEGSENRISVERRHYIQEVTNYNQLVMNFPTSFVASQKGMKVKDYYKASTSAQKAPKISLD